MKSFDEWFGEASQNKLFWESPSKASKMGFEAGAQSKQAEVDELRKHKKILLGELFLVSDAIQYRRVLNLLKGDQS